MLGEAWADAVPCYQGVRRRFLSDVRIGAAAWMAVEEPLRGIIGIRFRKTVGILYCCDLFPPD
jgi:hypothetical protein